MPIDTLLEQFTNRMGLEKPHKESDSYQLLLPPDCQMGIRETPQGIFLSCLILPIPREGSKEALYIYLMKANFIRQGTGSGVIGIDPSNAYFTFSQTLPLETNETQLKEAIEDCVNYISYWQEEIMRFQQTLI